MNIERNLRLLVFEIFWAGIHIACLSFNAAFLIHLGGTNGQVSLLTAGAALIVALTTMPFAALMERSKKRRNLIIGGLLAARLLYGLIIFLPWFPGDHAQIMVGVIIFLNIGSSLFSAGWVPLLGEIIPIERRARLFAQRSLTLGATVAISTLLIGRWLEYAIYPFNYQAVYILSLFTSLISTLCVALLEIPEQQSHTAQPAEPKGDLAAAPTPKAPAPSMRPFINMTFNTLIFSVPAWMAIPLQPIYFVRELGAGEGWLGTWAALVSGGAILGNLFWQRVIDRHGSSGVLVISTMLSVLYFGLIAAIPDLNFILLISFLSGIITPGVEISHLSTLYAVSPPTRQTTYLGAYMAIMNVGAFLTPLLVAPLIDLTGAQMVVALLCAIRLAGALLFWLNPVRQPTEHPQRVTSA